MKWQAYAKAIVGALAAGLSVLATSAADGISLAEALAAVAAALVGLGAVFVTPNSPAPESGVPETVEGSGSSTTTTATDLDPTSGRGTV